MGLEISTLKKEEENAVIFSLKGSLDTDTHEKLRVHADKYILKGVKALVLDLGALDYISSMGVSSILEVRKKTETSGAAFAMTNIPAHIAQVFKIINALPNVRIFEDMAEADRYLKGIQDRIKEDKGPGKKE